MTEETEICPICGKEMQDEDWTTDDPESPCFSCQQTKADMIYDQMKEE